MSARSAGRPGLSQKDCFPGRGSGYKPAYEDCVDRYCSRHESMGEGHNGKMSSWRGRVLATDAKKAGIATDDTF